MSPSTSSAKGAVKAVTLRNKTPLPAPTSDSRAAIWLLGKHLVLSVLQWSEPLCELPHSEVEDNQFALSQEEMVAVQECVKLT